MINEEMPETDDVGTLKYILGELKKGKIITLASCRFKASSVIMCSI